MNLRYEYKYIIPVEKQDILREMILPFVELDKYAQECEDNHYTVKSIYFDSHTFGYYFEKINHEKHRKKIRIRGYNNEAPGNKVFLEIKRKFEVPIFKNRAPLKYIDALELFKDERIESFVKNSTKFPNAIDDATRFMYHVKRKNLHPVINVMYEREPYFAKFNKNIRLTFDKNLRSSPYPAINELYEEKRIKNSLQGFFILEVKFDKFFPAWLKPIISTLQLRKEPASKYTICIDSHCLVRKPVNNSGYTFSRLFNNQLIQQPQ